MSNIKFVSKVGGSSPTTLTKPPVKSPTKEGGQSFVDHLKEGVAEVNRLQVTSDKMSSEIAVGKSENLHETMFALAQAELSFNLMVQVRNKALEAYQEIMRMPV